MNGHQMKFSYQIIFLLIIFIVNNCDSNKRSVKTMDNGLVIEDLVVGEGQEAKDYNKVVVNYTGTLEDGSIFDSSLNPGREPFTFTLGVGSVIKGWDLGVKDMKVGGKRKLTIPPELGYGDKGAGNVIPPGATLIFEVELLEVEAY
jgi:FKBP-type peptidyl-prolyl cis-trans isomerase FkpA|tara:strand:- start:360 stop:797 length:438 start_codon:yes stop_codon:yes gene_type:complete